MDDNKASRDSEDSGKPPDKEGKDIGYYGPPLPDGCVPIPDADADKIDPDKTQRKERKNPRPCIKKQKSINLLDSELSVDGPLEAEYVGKPNVINNRRQQCIRTFFTFIYILLAVVAVVFTYALIYDLVNSMNNPVRSIHYSAVERYDAPGIAIFPGGAKLLSCWHYFNNIVTSKVRLSDLHLTQRNCTFINMTYDDPFVPSIRRSALMFRGPTQIIEREAVFFHFMLEDETRDFYTVSYYVFPDWDQFNKSSPQERNTLSGHWHRTKPTYALSSGLRMWIKLQMKKTQQLNNEKYTDFKVEYSVVKHHDRRPESELKKHLFFIFFEWKDNIYEESYLLTTTTPWSIGAGLCGVLLTLHKGYQLAQVSFKRMKKDKQRRKTLKRTAMLIKQQSQQSQQSEMEAES
ncbi:proton-activated chloride channel-like isoform X2 [Lineus longissimus]